MARTNLMSNAGRQFAEREGSQQDVGKHDSARAHSRKIHQHLRQYGNKIAFWLHS